MNDIATNDPATFDVRDIPCREKHAQIFRRWTELPVGGHFVLVNDHDPVPLYYQFAANFPDAFTWEYLRSDEEFHVRITRTAATPGVVLQRPPVGGCGNHQPSTPDVLDVRGLEPPEPMMRIMAALATLAPGRELKAVTDRKPVHLLAELEQRAIASTCEEQADGSWLNTFRL